MKTTTISMTNKLNTALIALTFLGLTACSSAPTGGTGSVTENTATTNNGNNQQQQEYVVQMFATSDFSKATDIRNTFIAEGYSNTIISTINKNGQAIHRVQIGPFVQEATGDQLLAKMRTRYLSNQYVNGAVVKTVFGR